jgi:hypothetical protein
VKKIILWSVASVLIIGIAVAAIWWLRRPQIITLSDGTKLTLLGVDYGTHHKFPTVKVKTTGRRRGGPTSIDTTNDTLVVWIEAEHMPNRYPNYQVMVYDKAATACVGNWGGGNSRQIKNGMEVMGVQLDAFPRRDRKIYLRIAAWNNNGGGMKLAKGQFVISNPARGSFPKWTADPLPDTQSDDDLTVTLTRFNYGARGFNGGNAPANDPMSKAVSTAFHTEQKGVVVTNWQPVRIETSDATGNHIFNNSWSNSRDDNGDATMTYQWGLWPDEPAWKLRVEMSRTSGFNDDEIWSVTNVPINPGSQQDLWNYGGRRQSRTNSPFTETTLNGFHLKLYPAIQFTDQNFNGQKQGGFRIDADPVPEGMRLTIVSATDEQGHKLQSWNAGYGNGGNYTIQLQNLRNAKSLNVTIALHKSRFVEFTVKPQKASDASVP